MRKRFHSILIPVVVVAIVGCIALGAVTTPQKPKDLRDFLLQPPNSVYQEYGYSEETLLLYNLVTLKEVCQKHEVRIKALEEKLAELTAATIIDPNEE